MSRLDAFIRRLEAQRACLDLAVALTRELPGCFLELGLGNGRSYDHLRARAGDRPIYVFDRQVAAHPDCIPPERFLILGDFADTLPAAHARMGGLATLAHLDVGSGHAERDHEIARQIARNLPALLAPGAIIVADQPLEGGAFHPLPLPAEIAAERYFVYRYGDG